MIYGLYTFLILAGILTLLFFKKLYNGKTLTKIEITAMLISFLVVSFSIGYIAADKNFKEKFDKTVDKAITAVSITEKK